MNSEILATIDQLQSQLKKQAALFFRLSEINENDLSVKEVIQQASEVISDEWIDSHPITTEISFNKIVVRSKNYSETPWNIQGTGTIGSDSQVCLKINFLSETNSLEEYQTVADTIANNLASKIDRILTHNEMVEKREFLDKAYKLARIGTWEYDMINDKLYWSDITKDVHGFGPEYQPDVESTVMLFKEGFHRDTFAKAAEDAIQRNIPFDVELKIISGEGDERWIRATGVPEFENGVCVRFYGISQNVTNRKQAKEDLQYSERRFKALVQDGSDLVAILDGQANYKYVSPPSLKILGLSPEILVGQNALDYIHDDDKDRVFAELNNLGYREQVQIEPFRFSDVNGNWRWVETTLTNLTEDPAVRGYVANSRDITDQYLHQMQIERSYKKQEILLTEIHHRIKNNLSTITGLLQLQSLKENNSEVIDRLSDSVTRIHAMASMHEQLYQSSNFTNLDLSDQIKLLVLNIQNTLQSQVKVNIIFQCESVKLRANKALPVSLIINEIVTNIFKHAFKGRESGEILISLESRMDKRVELKIADNGIGLPDNLEEKMNESLGLTLIKSLTDQLATDFNLKTSEKGTTFSMIV